MNIKVVSDKISVAEVKELAKEFYGDMVKGVADIERGIIALGGEYHMDANNVLVERGSDQQNVWGFNIYVDKPKDQWLEYTALINIRPLANNKNMAIQNREIRAKIKKIVAERIR